MQVLILAAGMGTRLGNMTKEIPKCLVKVNNKPFIHYALDSVWELKKQYKIDNIIIVVGYKSNAIIDFLGFEYKGIPITYVENTIYDKTNNIYSLFLAKDYLVKDDTILIESDLIFSRSVLKKCIDTNYPCAIVLDILNETMNGTTLLLDDNNNIKNFTHTKKLNNFSDINAYKTVNIYKFSAEFSKKYYMPFLKTFMDVVGVNNYYEDALKIVHSIAPETISPCILDNSDFWIEIDSTEELIEGEKILLNKEL